MKCAECRWWWKVAEYTGQCRQQPPQVVARGKDQVETAWPETASIQWCAQFMWTRDRQDAAIREAMT